MRKAPLLVALLLVAALAACAQPNGQPVDTREADLAAITEAGEQLMAALNADDVPGILAGLTADHITMAPDVAALADRDALTSWHQWRIDNFTTRIAFSSEEIRLLGDYAVQRWSTQLQLVPREEGVGVDGRSKGVWVWQRQADGSWKLLWSIWNHDSTAESKT